jgi:hypothetical protein
MPKLGGPALTSFDFPTTGPARKTSASRGLSGFAAPSISEWHARRGISNREMNFLIQVVRRLGMGGSLPDIS